MQSRTHAASVLLLLHACVCSSGQQMVAPSPSELQTASDIWTTGPVLKAVNDVGLYEDSKTYVDQPLVEDQSTVLAAFQQLPKIANGSVDRVTLGNFVNTYFGQAGSDLDNTTAEDYEPRPANFLPLVKNDTILQWGYAVNALWNYLSRVENSSVVDNPALHSLLILPYPAVVAGDRFREMYYWDSYFVIQGLLVSGMKETAKNMVDNLISLLLEHGLVPNGARTYYLNRSQPPLLSEMAKEVFAATNDTAFLADAFAALEAEHKFWTQAPLQVTVQSQGRSYQLARYWSTLYSPRPESYAEDVATAEGLDPQEQAALWHNLASGAASGWDFSSRWFKDGTNLSTCQTSLVLPADLNALLYQMEANLADFAEALGEAANATSYRAAAAARKEAVNTLLWNQTAGHWHDIIIDGISEDNVVTSHHAQTRTYASNWTPLWAGLADPQSPMAVAATVSLASSGLIQAGGVLTSLYNTSQQWDAPNAWPPLQYFVIEGLNNYGDAAAQKLAAQIAQTWLESNYVGYLQNGGRMIEKYDGITPGVEGGGGEYNVQTGFGWTNGVMLYLLQNYGWVPGNSLAGSSVILPINISLAGA